MTGRYHTFFIAKKRLYQLEMKNYTKENRNDK